MQKIIIFTVTNDLSTDQRMIRICETLSSHNYDVELVGRKRSSSVSLKKRNYKQTRLKCFFNNGKIFYLEYNIRLILYLFLKKINIVCAIDLDTLAAIYIISNIKKINIVFDAHEYFTEVPELINRPFTRNIWLKLEKIIVPKLKYCYTVNESLAKIFQKKYTTQFKVIKNVPSLKQHLPDNEPKTDKSYILYQGVLNKGRGLENLIRAMADVPMQLYLAGDGDVKNNLVVLTTKLKINKKIKFLGKLNLFRAGS
jgi:glycosyltransferase involved in cell wall biosynthesis